MSKLSRNILASAGVAVIVAAMIINGITQYKAPIHNTEKFENAQRNVQSAMQEYARARNYALQTSEDTLKKDKNYLAEKKKLNNLANKLFHGEKMMSKQEYLDKCQRLDKMTARVDSIADELCNAYISKNKDLIYATAQLNNAINTLEQIQRDNAVIDSLRNLPMQQRFNRGWENIQHDFHSALLKYHYKKLQRLNQKAK